MIREFGLQAAVFVGSLLVDLIPVMGPPAWIVMAFMQITFGLNLVGVLLCGVAGSTIGRFLLARYLVPRISSHLLNRHKTEDMQFLGERLNGKGWRSWPFVFLYTLTPIPTSPLFTAAGMAGIRPVHLLPPFFFGKLISDAVMVLAGRYSFKNAAAIATGLLTWRSLAGVSIGVALLAGLLFVDWRTLLLERRLRMNLRIWKRRE